MFNLTKIICTIGPSSNSPETIRKLIESGMDVARLNFSHGRHEAHLENINKIRDAAANLDAPIAILADLQGPKIRVSALPGGPIELKSGAEVTMTTRENAGGPGIIPTVYRSLPGDVRPGSTILLDDGLLELKVVEIKSETDVLCKVIKGGILKEKKGINLPDVNVSAPALTEKDIADLEFALKNGADYIALSFVRHASDIEKARRMIHKLGYDVPVIAKIERPEAVLNFESILKAADGIMVARGDMGVELAPEKVPQIQKSIIKKCNLEGKPVIVATQMLESMIENPRPTRAEASDVANAIIDGTDAIMLSGETASGKYPVEAVNMMSKIAKETEALVIENHERSENHISNPLHMVADSLCHATRHAARDIRAKMIATYTESGLTPLLVSKYRPHIPILAATISELISRRINLYWGVMPVVIEKTENTDAMVEKVEKAAVSKGGLKPGDHIIITGGMPVGRAGTTNMLKIHKITGAALEKKAENVYVSTAGNVSISIDLSKCSACGHCVESCPYKIYGLQGGRVFINADNLNECPKDGRCAASCPYGAIEIK